MTAPLVIEGLRIRHEGAEAPTPDGVSFSVAPGETVLILGPSGSGKSTLTLALDGLTPHAVPAELEGRILVDGLSTTEHTVAELSAHVAMVFQDPDAQIVTGTLLDEVCFGPENLRLPVEVVLQRAESALRTVGLWHRRDENPDRLSGGGRQRLAIACALALDAPVIVLDEPTANLDPVGIDGVYSALATIVARGDRSIVLVEHNLDACLDLVDRVVVIDRAGAPVVTGPVDEVLRGHAVELAALGVWLPVATLAALRLRKAGMTIDRLPLTPAELTVVLDGIDRLPDLPPPGSLGTAGEPAISVAGLTVTRRGVRLLDDVSLDVPPSAFVAIVGENGAGKTTLLQAIAGVAPPPRGRVRIGDLDPGRSDPAALARRIGFVFQNPEHQFIRHTVAEELAHGLEIQRMPADQIAVRVDAMLERFGLRHLREQHPFLLSGGQKRRLSVGTALIAGAPVLALDEPTFGQDRERASELLGLLGDLNADGTTVLVVTHDMQLVADHASHIAVMRSGRLIAFERAAILLAGDTLEEAGLRHPPLGQAMRALTRHPAWRGISRMRDLPLSSAERARP